MPRQTNGELVKHIFNLIMWLVLMVVPLLILLLVDGLKNAVTKGYWPYKAWVERTFPIR